MNATPSSALKHLHPGWALPVLALGALALAWLEAAPLLGDLAGAGALVLTAVAGTAAVVLAVASLVRWQRYPQALADDLKHPARHGWVAAMPSALVLLGSLGAALLGPNPWFGGLWGVGSAWNFGVAAWLCGRWLRPGAAGAGFWAGVTPILWVAVTGLCLAALAGPGLDFEAMALAQLGVGVLLGVLTLGLLAVRLATSGVWSERLLPTLFLGAAPPAVCGLVAAQPGGSLPWAWMAWGIALFALLWSGAVLRRVLAQPIGLTFWAPAVSLALFAALSLRLAPTAGGLFQTFALLTLAVASLLVAVLTLATVKGLREGSWLGPETVAALQVAAER
ncbi:MAG: hypothetical protein Fur0019_03570 [Tibeticola sp.]